MNAETETAIQKMGGGGPTGRGVLGEPCRPLVQKSQLPSGRESCERASIGEHVRSGSETSRGQPRPTLSTT
jgi:hypothetical protein